jgi:cytochrome c nitrite reductase small subunit
MPGITQRSLLAFMVAAILGVLFGLSAYTLIYARGYSYLQDDPQVCVNCHVMKDNMNSWLASSHRTITCNDCHLPHQLVPKYLVKAEHGLAHSWAFTFTQPQVIRIKDRSLEVVQHNCAECHREVIEATFLASEVEPRRCSLCHPGSGHAE